MQSWYKKKDGTLYTGGPGARRRAKLQHALSRAKDAPIFVDTEGAARSMCLEVEKPKWGQRERRNLEAWATDAETRELVGAHPDGMSHSEIAAYLGISKQRVEQIEQVARKKIAREARRLLEENNQDSRVVDLLIYHLW